ncbi:MAG: UDP-2,4-diacetamido-2,4,6-trideoxy-beta-L-altropyranose hydrolase [Denitromonas halophila]|nr:MAG: UDP-2,4-diacetamido-2,4,6-trideoxy-beta-L-altropyranose hydrolase [Denitromonas halophila]
MNIVIRADSSVEIGSGHVMRCLTLADRLRESGAQVAFLCADLPGAMLDLIRARGYRYRRLSSSVAGDWAIDAEESIAAVADLVPGIVDWVIVDHYQIDYRWEEMLRLVCSRLMVIDDIANRRHSCDLLLDQNYDDQLRYRNLVPVHCKCLLGPTYALLRTEYGAYRAAEEVRNRPLRRAFVFFGGSDPADLTGMAIKALSEPALVDLAVDVVVGANYSHRDALVKLAAARGNTTIHDPRPHLADLMAEADIAIGAGGVTNWERMTVGLPSVVIAIADNQVPISEQLHGMGAIRYLGKAEHVSEGTVRNALMEEVSEMKYLARIAPAMATCDGRGVGRVFDAISSFECE